jgi:hypothetical protein
MVESHNIRAGVEEMNGMETMEIHLLERALMAACIIAAVAVVWWGFKIMAAWSKTPDRASLRRRVVKKTPSAASNTEKPKFYWRGFTSDSC